MNCIISGLNKISHKDKIKLTKKAHLKIRKGISEFVLADKDLRAAAFAPQDEVPRRLQNSRKRFY